MRDRLIELLQSKSCWYNDCETGCDKCGNVGLCDRDIEIIADYLLANGAVVLPGGTIDALYSAVDALADMVNQFGYSTTFRKQDAVCDGGLSALENAFGALFDCGYRLNSNGTINRKNLWNYSVKEEIERLLKGGGEE